MSDIPTLTRSLRWTLLAVFAPACAHGTAADHQRLRLGHRTGTRRVGEVHVAQFLSHINTFS